MRKLLFVFILIVIALAFWLVLTARAEPEAVLAACENWPTPAFEGAPSDLDWNSDTARAYNCYDPKTRTVKGIVWGSNKPANEQDNRTLWARWTITYGGKTLTEYQYTVGSKPNIDGVPYIYFEYQMPGCLDNTQFHVVTDYYQRDDAGHGMRRDWSGYFYAQSHCLNFPMVLYMPGGNTKPKCCETCQLSWTWIDNGVVKPLDAIQFVNLAEKQINTSPLFTLWQPDELEAVIDCAPGQVITDITVKIIRFGSLFKDISERAQDRQFRVSCGTFGYLTDTMLVVVSYKDAGCVCATQRPVKDP